MSPDWVIAGLALLAAVIGVPLWAYATFQTKREAEDRREEDGKRHDALEGRVSRQDDLLNKVAQDVSYIRGAVESRFVQRDN